MPGDINRERAQEPEDLSRLFLDRANAGDVDGIVALYEPDAVLASPPGTASAAPGTLPEVYERLLADRPKFAGDIRPALICGDLALTSTRFNGDATAEIARRQPDGTWLWVVDQPNVIG